MSNSNRYNNGVKVFQVPIYQQNVSVESELRGLTRPNSKCAKCKFYPRLDVTSYKVIHNEKKHRCCDHRRY